MTSEILLRDQNYLLMGLPGSGKPTLLAALWHTVCSEEVPTAFVLETVEGDISYLNKITEKWLACEAQTRTSIRSDQGITLLLKSRSKDLPSRLRICIPDLAGEIFEQQWCDRKWTKTFAERVRTCDGVILAIHASDIVEPTSVVEMQKLAQCIPADSSDDSPLSS